MVSDANLQGAEAEIFAVDGLAVPSISPKRATRSRVSTANCCSRNFTAKQREGFLMAYLVPSEFVTKMVDAGEPKIFMSTRDTLIRAYMPGAILALAAALAVIVNSQT